MSNEEAIQKAKPVWWQRAKKLIFFSQFLHSAVVIIGVLYGASIIMETKIAAVLAIPKRITALERKDSSQFCQTDSALDKHNGLFLTVFQKIDTNKRYTRR